MNIIEATNKDEYNQFILANNGNFQQSWEWMELQERMNRKTKRLLALDENSEPRMAASFVRHTLPLNQYYWIAPRGPIIRRQETVDRRPHDLLSELLSTDYGLQNAMFIRIEPEIEPKKLQATSYKLVNAPHDHSPRATILIDLTRDEDDLLMDMRSKTRYNIRLSGRKGVEARISDERLVISDFLDLLERTAERDEFSIHPRKYYEEMLKLPFIKLFTAHLPPHNPPLSKGGKEGGLVAGAIVSFWGDRATYLHGASSYKHRKVMAPHLLHWEIVGEAKKQELRFYDFGGVAPKDAPDDHPWQGITRFKKGFGGEYVECVGTLDYIQKPFWYTIYKTARRVL